MRFRGDDMGFRNLLEIGNEQLRDELKALISSVYFMDVNRMNNYIHVMETQSKNIKELTAIIESQQGIIDKLRAELDIEG
jgi:hypothetical protein